MTAGGAPMVTPRELEVLKAMACGMNRRETAAEMFVAPSTVAMYRLSLFRKLDARNAPHAVMLALRAGLLNGEEITNG